MSDENDNETRCCRSDEKSKSMIAVQTLGFHWRRFLSSVSLVCHAPVVERSTVYFVLFVVLIAVGMLYMVFDIARHVEAGTSRVLEDEVLGLSM